MKLDIKKTIKVGLAFLSIQCFWGLYDAIIPLILTNDYGLNATWRGLIMALDNILALFMLPLFGAISDKCTLKSGRRTPFFTIGTICAALLLVAVSFTDYGQTAMLMKKGLTDNQIVYEQVVTTDETLSDKYTDYLTNPDNYSEIVAIVNQANKNGANIDIAQLGSDAFRADFFQYITQDKLEIDGTTRSTIAYTSILTDARIAYSHRVTMDNPACFVIFIILLLLSLVSMATYRSPAVALMPDVTPKPLRSGANAIINIMGGIGTILAYGFMMLKQNYNGLRTVIMFSLTAVTMLIALVIFRILVNEKQLVLEKEELVKKYNEEHGTDIENEFCDPEDGVEGTRKLSKGQKVSMLLILASIFLWFMGYNAMSSNLAIFVGNTLGIDGIQYSLMTMIPMIASAVMFIPSAMLANKIGRRWSIISGIALLIVGLVLIYFFVNVKTAWLMYPFLMLVSAGWATISINSLPMIVELSNNSTVGKYTGYYYTFSMGAQCLAPVIVGLFIDYVFHDVRIVLPYGAIFIFLSGVTMFFVKHGDNVKLEKSTNTNSEVKNG